MNIVDILQVKMLCYIFSYGVYSLTTQGPFY